MLGGNQRNHIPHCYLQQCDTEAEMLYKEYAR